MAGLSWTPPVGLRRCVDWSDITAEMVQAYRVWRYESVQVYSAGHADLVGIHSAVV